MTDFSIDGGGVLEAEPRATFDEGVLFGVVGGAPVMTVAWREEIPGTTIEEAVGAYLSASAEVERGLGMKVPRALRDEVMPALSVSKAR